MSTSELYNQGYTILHDVIGHETCDTLRRNLSSRFGNNLPFNFEPGHYQLKLPDTMDNLPIEIIMSPTIHKFIQQIFSTNYYMSSLTCNANLAKKNQPYHMDCSHFHSTAAMKGFGSVGPPVQLIVNVYLQDTDEKNGSLEIVPGSHKIVDFEMNEDGIIDEKYVCNSVRCNLSKGSVIIRDKRTWHRGTINHTDEPRYMVGSTYTLNWYRLNHLTFHSDTELFWMTVPFSTWNLEFYKEESPEKN